jgi:predicted nucleic acid-binding protein
LRTEQFRSSWHWQARASTARRRFPDLLIAAAAEVGGLTVLHLDKDFDLIASITAQPAHRLRL